MELPLGELIPEGELKDLGDYEDAARFFGLEPQRTAADRNINSNDTGNEMKLQLHRRCNDIEPETKLKLTRSRNEVGLATKHETGLKVKQH